MILATDVHYHKKGATAAGVLFPNWQDKNTTDTFTVNIPEVADYIPGQFYHRELPCLLSLLEQVTVPLDVIIVDGFVYLDGVGKAGLGKHLYDALDGKITVMGVAKSAFCETPSETEVLRGKSRKPLYVTAVGLPLTQAKQHLRDMHGEFRLPTLLKQVDRLCRQ